MELDYVIEWFRFADSDLASADYLQGMFPKPIEIICYHCQQSVEKFLKGYLIFNGINEPPKTHNLVELCESAAKFEKSFQEIAQICGILTRYGVLSRYPRELEISESDIKNAINYARQIRDFKPLREVRIKISTREGLTTDLDPFYSSTNMERLKKAIADANAGRNMTEHELIEVDDD